MNWMFTRFKKEGIINVRADENLIRKNRATDNRNRRKKKCLYLYEQCKFVTDISQLNIA